MFHKKRGKWEPQPDDAIKLAALRWFACTIEAEAIQLYATNSGKYDVMVEALRACVQSLRDASGAEEGDEDCPPGYVRCGRECAPMCYNTE